MVVNTWYLGGVLKGSWGGAGLWSSLGALAVLVNVCSFRARGAQRLICFNPPA